MYFIGHVLVSEDVTRQRFACNIAACQGACCWEGDFGAPLEAAELPILDAIYDRVKPLLTEAGRAAIEAQGKYIPNPEGRGHDTPLVDNRACAYMTLDGTGTAHCGIEQAYNAGLTDWKKPISCHLYPIRVKTKPEANFEALNYDVWDICSAACTRGEREKIRVFEFARPALVRKYGEAWYEELAAAVAHEEGPERE